MINNSDIQLFFVLKSTLEYLANVEQPANSRSRTDLKAKGGITYDLGKKQAVLMLILEICPEVICSQYFLNPNYILS